MMNQEFKFGKNMLVLSIMTLITVIIWVGCEVYSAYTKTTVPRIIKELIKPLSPDVNETVIEEIKNKYQIPEGELNIVTQPVIESETEEEATPSQTPD